MATALDDLKGQLQESQDGLKTVNTQLDDLQSKAQSLRTKIQTLSAAVSDCSRAASSYGTDAERLTAAKKSVDDAIAKLAGIVGDKIKPKKDEIDKAIAAQEKTLSDLGAAAKQAQTDADKANEDAGKAADDVKAAGDSATQLSSLVQQGTATVTEAGLLLKQAQDLVNGGNAAGASFLISEAQKLKLDLPAAADLAEKLADAQKKGIAAKAAAADKTAAATKAKAASDTAGRAWAAAKAARRATIVAALKPLN